MRAARTVESRKLAVMPGFWLPHDQVAFRSDGHEVAYVVRDEVDRLFVGTELRATADVIIHLGYVGEDLFWRERDAHGRWTTHGSAPDPVPPRPRPDVRTLEPRAEWIEDVVLSDDERRVAFTFVNGAERVYDRGPTPYLIGGTWTLAVDDARIDLGPMQPTKLQFSRTGAHVAFVGLHDGKAFAVIDDRASPPFDDIFTPRFRGEALTFGARSGAELWWQAISAA
jgi:hypothetical protein